MKYSNYFKFDICMLMFPVLGYIMFNAILCIPYIIAFSCFGVYDFYKMNKGGICASEV